MTWISNQLTTKSLESQTNWQPNHWNRKSIGNHTHLNLKSIDNQNHLNPKSIDSQKSQINWQPKSIESHISWQPKSCESQISWHPNHLNLTSIDNINHLNLALVDNQITWISDQPTTKPVESQITWQPKSFENQTRWQPHYLNLKSTDNRNIWLSTHLNDINWLSNQLNSTHLLPIGSLSLETSATASCGRYVMLMFSSQVKLARANHIIEASKLFPDISGIRQSSRKNDQSQRNCVCVIAT